MKPSPKEINSAVEAAQEAFWAVVVEHFPQIHSGDMSPWELLAFDNACLKAVDQWVDNNYLETFTDRQEAYRAEHPASDEDPL